ncbi:MAG: hypothetical protein M1828_005655 [Chrysothrix sp. TS-e1954]|nr:MAG: hypothetical protein M1828_005655 [Chrysothrix sp. TS-e1954]
MGDKRPLPDLDEHANQQPGRPPPSKAARTSHASSPHGRTSTIKHPSIPHYDDTAPLPTSHGKLPPLPPISDAEIERAVFTHAESSSHSTRSSNENSNSHTQNGAPPPNHHTNGTTSPPPHLPASKLPTKQQNYESLEFLGDAYLEILSTRLIFSRYPSLPAGRQAQLRESLVWNTQLCRFANAYGFRDRIRMTPHGWAAMQPKKREKVLADVFEAYVAGVMLSDPVSGFEEVERWMGRLWGWSGLLEKAEVLDKGGVSGALQEKDRLARLVGGKEVRIEYVVEKAGIREKGVKQQEHEVSVYLTGWGLQKRRLGGGKGCGAKEAGQRAAVDAIEGGGREVVVELAEKKLAFDRERRDKMARENGETEEEQGKA